MKKKLLITVGAGASVEFELPSVSDVDKLFDTHAANNYPLAHNRTLNLYGFIRDAIDAYYAKNSKLALRKWTNFEEIIYQLNLLASHLTDNDYQQGSNALWTPNTLPAVLDFKGRPRPVDRGVLSSLSSSLLDNLTAHFITQCDTASSSRAKEIGELTTFLDSLREEFDVGVITLNYDNIFTQASPSLFTGFDAKGRFDSTSVLTRLDWEFIYHLHGSIHFKMQAAGSDLHTIGWENNPTANHTTQSAGRSSQTSMEGTPFPTAPIVAGYGKTQQLLRQPFRTYFAQTSRLVHEADALLFVGYGFNDLHLNATFSEVRNKRRPVAVISFAKDTEDSLPFRADQWAYNLGKTIPSDLHAMSAPGQTSPADVSELKQAREFEVSTNPNYPLAVWYNGFLEACRHPAKVLAQLL